MDCIFYYDTMSMKYEYFELTSAPKDYKIKFDIMVFGEDGAKIVLSERKNSEDEVYLFGM